MSNTAHLGDLKQFEIPGSLRFELGGGGLPKALLSTQWSQCEIYLHGAQVTHFQKLGEAPLLFLSQASRFQEDAAIRGGIPICFPWFGARPGVPSHGYARLSEWRVLESRKLPSGSVGLKMGLPRSSESAGSDVILELEARAGKTLELDLTARNPSLSQSVSFEVCLHTYLAVADVERVEIQGLESAPYLDHTRSDQTFLSPPAPLRIDAQTDRSYLNHSRSVEVRDPGLGRAIHVHKLQSASTVVWNPWTTQVLADLGPEEYRRFICVESGNIGVNRITLPPAESCVLQVEIESKPWQQSAA